MMFFTPGTSCSAVRGAARRTVAPQATLSSSTPSGISARRTSASIWSLSGQAGVVSSMVKATLVPLMTRSRIMFRLTRSPPSSGSWTVRRAARTSDSVMALMEVRLAPCGRDARGRYRRAGCRIVPAGRPGCPRALPGRVTGADGGPEIGTAHVANSCDLVPADIPGVRKFAESDPANGPCFANLTPPSPRSYRSSRRRASRVPSARTPGPPGTTRPVAVEELDCARADVDVRLVDITKAFGDVARRRPHRPRGGRWRVLQPAGPVRLRQDHDAAHDRRLRAAHLRPDRAPGPGRDLAAALPAQRQHRLPELRAVPAPLDLRERRLRPAPHAVSRTREIKAAGPPDARAGASCPGSRRASPTRSRVARRSAWRWRGR